MAIRLLAFVAAWGLLLTNFPVVAVAPDPQEKDLGFVELFEGKSFAGWQHNGNWEIQDGVFARVRKGGNLTYTAGLVPDDFELRFDWKVSKGCNSGVYYRPGQVEYQVLDDENSPYGENPRQSAASLFFCMAPSKRAALPYGQWNTARIICKDTVIEHWLNDQRVCHSITTTPSGPSRSSCSASAVVTLPDVAASYTCRIMARTSGFVTCGCGRFPPTNRASPTRTSSQCPSLQRRSKKKRLVFGRCWKGPTPRNLKRSDHR